MNNNELLKDKMFAYYKKYYSDELGFKDWKARCKLRLDEEKNYCLTYISRIKEWINYDFTSKKVLVVGSGTGGEIVNFHMDGADVYGIEPNIEALEISQIKAEIINLEKAKIKEGYAENLIFEDNTFDFVYCYTVLEHVRDIEQSISEMIRVAKEDGYIFIHTPDYRQLYEPHYKLSLPMFLPNFISKLILFMLGRPTKFLDTIKKVNSLSLRRIFQRKPIHHFRMFNQIEDCHSDRMIVKIIYMIQRLLNSYLGIAANQAWLLKKKKPIDNPLEHKILISQ